MAAKTPAARTPGAKRAGPGEHLFDLAKVNHLLGGPDYSTANGAVVEGDRMIVGLMRMPAGTGAEPHSHPNEQWIYVLEGTLRGNVGDQKIEAKAGSVIYIPADAPNLNVATLRRRHPRGATDLSSAATFAPSCRAATGSHLDRPGCSCRRTLHRRRRWPGPRILIQQPG